ncbi:MAG TPA: glycosyltransferase [Candidatus Hydrogenedentes bacterium]|nr:glycosyltransferase [Candidatus Hydrogenedentota bacterium]
MTIKLQGNTLDLSVVIPTLNEAPNLEILLPVLRESLDELDIQWEILVVDAESQDGTQQIAEKEGACYVSEAKSGYGTAILRGFSEAKGEYVLTMDADLSHPAQIVKELWAVREQADMSIASRYVEGGEANQPWVRLQLSRILNTFFGKGLSIKVRDMSSGFRIYRKNILSRLDIQCDNFVIVIELLLKAYAQGFTIQEIPFHYQPRGEGSSKARIIAFGKDYIRLFRQIRNRRNSVMFPDYDWRAHNSWIPLQRYWQRKRHSIIMRFTPENVSTCDIGCGSSHILADLPHSIGVDLRHDKLAFMRNTNKHLVQGDGMGLPFLDEQFDCVISSEVIEHIPDENGIHIDELTRILKPGGILILGTPDYGRWEWVVTEWLYGIAKPDAYADEHVTFYTFKSLSEAITSRGFEIIDHDYIGRGELIFQARKSV